MNETTHTQPSRRRLQRPPRLARKRSGQADRTGRLIQTELVFGLQAWLKLQYLCHRGLTEVGAFGISHFERLLYVEDLVVVRQRCSMVSVEFDDEAVADFFDEQIDDGRRPEQFGRLWLHSRHYDWRDREERVYLPRHSIYRRVHH